MRQPAGVVKRRRAARRYQSQEAPVPWSRRSRTMRRAMLNAAFHSSRDHGVASILEMAAVDFRGSDSFDTRSLLVSGAEAGGGVQHPSASLHVRSGRGPNLPLVFFVVKR